MFHTRYLKNGYLVRGGSSALHGTALTMYPFRSSDCDGVADLGFKLVSVTGKLMFLTAAVGKHVMVLCILQATLDRCHTGVLRERTKRKTNDHQSQHKDSRHEISPF